MTKNKNANIDQEVKMPRALTADEMRNLIYSHIAAHIGYWRDLPTDQLMLLTKETSEIQQRLEGLTFSILTMIDGSSIDIPPLRIYTSPNSDDIEDDKSCGKNYWGQTEITNVMLHEEMHAKLIPLIPEVGTIFK